MKAELALWRFAVGLLGGAWMAAIGLGAITCGYAALAYVICNPLRFVNGAESNVQMAAILSAMAFLSAAFAPTALRSAWRDHTSLRLAPGAKRMTSALTYRLILVALIAMVPAVILRSLLSVKFGDSFDATISLADVTFKTYAFVTLYLAHVVVLTTITFGVLKVSLRFLFLPIMYGTMQWSSAGFFWLPLATCSLLVIVRFCWPTLEAWIGAKPYSVKSLAERKWGRPRWWNAHLQKRVARAVSGSKGTRLRISALLVNTTRTPLVFVTGAVVVLYLVLKPGFMDDLVISWLFACPVAVALAQLSPIPLGRIMLLPLGAEREHIGAILTSVWVRELSQRMLLFTVVGLALHAFCWWLQWPAFIRSPFFARVDLATQLLWSPIAQSVGLYGVAVSVCLLIGASPRALETPSFLRAGPTTAVVLLAVVGIAFKWALNEWIPATKTPNMGHITFAIVNGVMLPACAWCVHRALRYQWSKANLAAISAAMQKWSARLQKAHSMQ